jgi:uncharacterized protein (DUF2235 family)
MPPGFWRARVLVWSTLVVLKRLVVCCDGTWNTPDEFDPDGAAVATNVTKLAFAVSSSDRMGIEQRTFYGKGVGTNRFDHVSGGAFGAGLSDKIQEAYMFLVDNFDQGDELFLFGFSRGAYTARSLAGLVRNSGILKRQYAGTLHAAYELYRDRSGATHPRSNEAQLFRRTYSFQTNIKFIGVWDTVGALGIPDIPMPAAIANRWKFHDVTLSTRVENAFQALAIDERRKPFLPTLWDQADDAPSSQVLQQVWFSGVHSDVGGGYRDAGLSDVSLLWLMSRAEACGLAVDRSAVPNGIHSDVSGQRHDSMTWLYGLLGNGVRTLPAVRLRENGQPMKTHEAVAATAQKRWEVDPTYRPAALREYFDRHGPVVDVPGVH